MKQFLISFLFITLITTTALAEYRIATVNINQILNETSESKDAREQLNKESLKAKALVDKKRKILEKKEASLKKKKIAPNSPEAEAFRQEAKDFRRFVKDTEDTLKRKFLRSNGVVTKKALEAIRTYAKSNKIDLVLDKGATGRSAVLFSAPSVDITKDVIKKLKG